MQEFHLDLNEPRSSMTRTRAWRSCASACRSSTTLAVRAARLDDRHLFETAVEELLRYDTPLPMFERTVLQDIDFNGLPLRRGAEVGLFYASGNRDPRRFPGRMPWTSPGRRTRT
jgi:cytochrome P450